jgi:hypothetical protein
MKRFILSLSILFALITHLQAQTYSYNDSRGREGFSLKSQDQQGIKINYSVREFKMDDLTVRGESMKHITLANHFLPGDEGMPDLPGSGRYIAVPQGATAVLHVKSVRKEIYRGINISPAPRIPKDNEKGPLDYNRNSRAYSNDAFYPAEPIQLSDPTKVRGVDAVILGITPFQYNPVTKELVVLRDIEVEVEFTGGNGRFGDDRLRSRWWDPLLSDLFLNYTQLPKVDYTSRQLAVSSRLSEGNRETGYEYLVICPDNPEFIAWADSIRLFRTMQGIYTGVVTTAEIGGNTTSAIENYVNNAYNTWDIPPAAILLMGDFGSSGNTIVSQIWDSYCVSDHLYADVGDDDEEEIIFARMTARNSAELQVMVRKAIDYERNPPTNPDFYNHPITALGWQTERWFQICSEVVGGYFRNVQGKDPVRINAVFDGNPDIDPWSTATNTPAVLDEFGPGGLGYIPASPTELGNWTGGNADDINAALNAGSFLLQHRDHGFEAGWGEPDYSISDIPGLTNTDLSFVFSINCLTGKYNYGSECFAEKLHRYIYNGQPAGALGLLAASETSYSFVNDVYVWGVYDNMFPDFMPDFGTTPASRGMLPAFGNAAGKFFLKYSNWPYNTEDKEVTYNLFHDHGDAFTCLYSEVPQNLTIIHEPVQIAGVQTFTIRADQDALIALSVNGELIGVGTGTGAPEDIPVIAQNPPEIIDVIVTKANYYRYHARVLVIPPVGPFVITDSYAVNDASGNNDGNLDYGETVSLDMTLKNLGSENAENVTATITSTDEYVTILDNSAQAGTIPAYQTAFIPGAFSIKAAGIVPNGHNIKIDVQTTDGISIWNSSFTVKAFAPILDYSGFSVSDAEGNNNGRLDPGETVDLTVTINNMGAADAFNVYGLLSTADTYIRIESDSAMFGDIAQNSSITKTFRVTAFIITPPGHQADFDLDFSGDLGLATTGAFSLSIGLFPILILDLDGNHNSADKIQSAIEDWRVFAEYSEVIPADISHYQSIFLCLGTYSTNHVLTAAEAAPFTAFLNNGGNLYMEGSDTWYYDQLYTPTSLHPKFNILGASDGTGDISTLNGIDGTFTEGMSFFFSGDNSYIDHISAVSPACNIFSNSYPVYNLAVAYNAGTYKTIGSSFEFGGLMDNNGSTKKNLMFQYLNYFGMTPISQMPETPVGDTAICAQSTQGVYSTQPVPFASYYVWEVIPANAGTVEGWDSEVTIDWNPVFRGNAYLRVAGMNQNGLGPVSSELAVHISELPTADLSFSSTNICAGDTTYASIFLTGESPWQLHISVGGNEIVLNPDKQNMDAMPLFPSEDLEVAILSVSDATGCIATGFAPVMISVMPLPPSPPKPSGPEFVDLFITTQTNYTTAGSDYTDSYSWSLTPMEAGNLTVSENGLECSIEWMSTYAGQAKLEVKGFNDCGEGDFSELLDISVANTFGVFENESGPRINIYPNPSDGNFMAELISDKSTSVKITLFSPTGEPSWGPVIFETGRNLSLPVHAESLPDGLYLILFETDMGIYNQKIIIKK